MAAYDEHQLKHAPRSLVIPGLIGDPELNQAGSAQPDAPAKAVFEG